jgi:hypothetical protein
VDAPPSVRHDCNAPDRGRAAIRRSESGLSYVDARGRTRAYANGSYSAGQCERLVLGNEIGILRTRSRPGAVVQTFRRTAQKLTLPPALSSASNVRRPEGPSIPRLPLTPGGPGWPRALIVSDRHSLGDSCSVTAITTFSRSCQSVPSGRSLGSSKLRCLTVRRFFAPEQLVPV